MFVGISDKLDFEKLVPKLSCSAHFPETFDPLCPKPFQNIFLEPDPKGTNPRFPDAAIGDEQTLKFKSRPLPKYPGMKYLREGNPRC